MPKEKNQKENYQNMNNGWIRMEDGDLFSLIPLFPNVWQGGMLATAVLSFMESHLIQPSPQDKKPPVTA